MIRHLLAILSFTARLVTFYAIYLVLTMIVLAIVVNRIDPMLIGFIGLFFPPIPAVIHAKRSYRRSRPQSTNPIETQARAASTHRSPAFGRQVQPASTQRERPPILPENLHLTTEFRTPRRDPSFEVPIEDRPELTSDTSLPPAKNKPGKMGRGWVPKSQSASVRGWNVGGMVYVGTPPRTDRHGEKCRAYIDPALPIGSEPTDKEGSGLDYWPGYSSIPPVSRATYLKWLADGRNDPAFNVGYMFLYFYGLERRFLVENSENDEKREILDEAERLRA